MRRQWYRLFPKGSLDGITQPTRVRVHGTIAEGALADSPVTDRRAAVIVWFFSRRFTVPASGRAGGSAVDHEDYRLLTRGKVAPPWIRVRVGDRLVRVDTSRLGVWVASSQLDGILIDAIPDALRHPNLSASDPNLRYGERWLAPGDTVFLDAEVQPVTCAAASPYRDGSHDRAPDADFETLGRALLQDTIGTDLRIG